MLRVVQLPRLEKHSARLPSIDAHARHTSIIYLRECQGGRSDGASTDPPLPELGKAGNLSSAFESATSRAASEASGRWGAGLRDAVQITFSNLSRQGPLSECHCSNTTRPCRRPHNTRTKGAKDEIRNCRSQVLCFQRLRSRVAPCQPGNARPKWKWAIAQFARLFWNAGRGSYRNLG